jgi:hypothetical protein
MAYTIPYYQKHRGNTVAVFVCVRLQCGSSNTKQFGYGTIIIVYIECCGRRRRQYRIGFI